MNEWRSAAVVLATNKGGGRAKEWGKIEKKKRNKQRQRGRERWGERERKREMGRARLKSSSKAASEREVWLGTLCRKFRER